jgi:oxygen-independent coproporphyrinogen-3 oxidase
MEAYFERVVERLTSAGYRWYETANFCRTGRPAAAPDFRARHNLAYWRGRDYVGLGIGAVSTVGGGRWTNAPKLGEYLAALGNGERPRRLAEPIDDETRRRERIMLGLRLDEPLQLGGLEAALDAGALARLTQHGLVVAAGANGTKTLTLSERGRFLGGGVTAELLA